MPAGASARAREVLATSAATGAGLDELRSAILAGSRSRTPARAATAGPRLPAEHRVYRPGEDEEIAVEQHELGRLPRARPARRAAVRPPRRRQPRGPAYVEERLRALGVIKALEAAGFEPGDDVEIAGIVFELHPVPRFGRSQPVRRALAVLLLPAALALPACGGGDERDPERVVRDFVDATNDHDAAKLCDDLLSHEFIAKTTGAKEGDTETCKKQLGAVRGLRLRLVEVRRDHGRRRQREGARRAARGRRSGSRASSSSRSRTATGSSPAATPGA